MDEFNLIFLEKAQATQLTLSFQIMTEELVSEINSKSLETGIAGSVSELEQFLLTETDGNDISLQNFGIGSGNLSARQINKFGEASSKFAA